MSAKDLLTTLHELASKSFNRTPNGLIFTNDLKTVYSLLLICLDLKEENPLESKSLLNAFNSNHNKDFSFTFSINEAIEVMKDLRLNVDMNATCIKVSYSIKPTLAFHLLKVFMSANLLHTPADRTRTEPKEKVLLQPTPKGVAILQKYVRDIGLKKLPEIIFSSFNSLDLFTFERSSMTDSIIHSDYLIHILFIRVMGPHANVWSPSNISDPLPSLSTLLEYSNDSFTFENMDYSHFSNGFGSISGHFNDGSHNYNNNNNNATTHNIDFESWLDQIPDEDLHDESRKSPFAHRFFTNPDSDSHIQYYVSDKGVRLFKSKLFGKNKTIIDYCFTTKAIWQWLMDCTDIMYPKEAVSVAALFLKMGFIVPILLPPSKNSKKKFHISRSSFYTLTKLGWDIIQWNTEIGIKQSINNFSNLKIQTPTQTHVDIGFTYTGNLVVPDEKKQLKQNIDARPKSVDFTFNGKHQCNNLDDILRDPGMRYLFRRHLEKELCVENLDALIDIKKFSKKMTLLKKLLDAKHNKESNNKNKSKVKSKSFEDNILSTIDSALMKQANECLEMAYHISSSYIMVGSPYQVNIDHNLRESVTKIMLSPQSPLSKSFSVNFHSNFDSHDEILLSTNNVTPKFSELSLKLTKPEPALKIDSLTSLSPTCMSPRQFKPAPLSLPPLSKDQYVSLDPFKNDTSDEDDKNLSCFYDDDPLGITLKALKKLYPLFEKVSRQMYHLMKIDSLQKFMNSDVYQEATLLIEKQDKTM
ncbi:GTPase-activating protein SST2 NDAI_0D00210 [Naumovozyma dairenensis CBS 421]|uniref:Protein SST2 n=1 Tax=Naumovozyma dairenensis (strain ATCC 10597 / BCRC 20456 / CBS 421 / NBRC 0211 / NRRL Y-12639) TaxID=1071378 RepID=G0W974_NAUDC|nr:hypothetical protein NDAI_0D00210 [Naumovozyma dairenensis CBS 421]CCD24335.1 hypothetical protein NDAI_0D00210 [Naumovozyma dairenensis CBS 421]